MPNISRRLMSMVINMPDHMVAGTQNRVYNMYPMGEDRWLRSRFREEEARLLKNHL